MNIWIYLLIMAMVSYAIRVTPMVFLRKRIESKTIRSFLFYVPYVTLAVMTFPAILEATKTPVSGLLALIAGILMAFFGRSLLEVALLCCLVVFVSEQILL